MNKITRPLEEITAEAVIIYDRMEKDYTRFGQLMLEAKALVPRGEFMGYLEKHFPQIKYRQAARYMELAKDPGKSLTEITQPTRVTNVSTKTHLVEAKPRETAVDREIYRLSNEALREWSQRSKVLIMHINQFLTKEEPVGRDLIEAVSNIDKFDRWEDIDKLKTMQLHCEELSDRARALALQIRHAISTKEKIL